MTADLQDQRAHMRDIVLDDFAQTKWMQRVNYARSYQLDPDKYARPFPGSTTTITNQLQGGGLMAKVWPILAAAGLGAGALGLGSLLGSHTGGTADAQSSADAGARVRVFWGEQEITPGQSASSGELKVSPQP